MGTIFSQINEQILAKRRDIAEAVLSGEVHFKRYNSDPPRFELYWPKIASNVPISLGDEIWSWATVQKAIWRVWNEVIYDMKPKDWHACLAILTTNAETVEEPGASMAAEVLDMLEKWLKCHNLNSWTANDLDTCPLIKDGCYYFRLAAFESHALFSQGSRFFYQRYLIPRAVLYEIMRNAGGASVVKKFRKGNIRLWQIPQGFNEPKDVPQGDIEEEYEEQ